MGKDGNTGNGLNHYFGKDTYGFSLNYFDTDYASIGETSFLASNSKSLFPLYNGNISSMVTTIQKYDDQTFTLVPEAVLNHYHYDQLNRISASNPLFSNSNVLANNDWTYAATNSSNALHTEFTNDENGNILSLLRNGSSDNTTMDNLSYHYDEDNNRLLYVDDIASGYTDDIDDQDPGNYGYDAIGNLSSDESESIGLDGIQWTVYGKIQEIQFTDHKPDIYFKYDATGKRISKTTIDSRGSEISTFYVRDAQGNVLTTYDKRTHHPLKISEQMIYGSSRLGLWDRFSELISYTPPQTERASHILGMKRYELTNHLGNVLTTVTDWKQTLAAETFAAEINSSQDYYPFGSLMPGRKYSSNSYRFGFNGMEKDDEVNGVTGSHYTTEFRAYDSRLGRWWSLDPYIRSNISMYTAFSNNPIIKVDPRGDDDYFDHNGNFLFRDTKKTTNIRIISRDVYQNLYQARQEAISGGTKAMPATKEFYAKLQSSSAPLSSFDYSKKANIMMLANVGNYYFNDKDSELGGTSDLRSSSISTGNGDWDGDGGTEWTVSYNNPAGGGMMSTDVDADPKTITIPAWGGELRAGDYLDDFWNMVNVFSHEEYHKNNHTSNSSANLGEAHTDGQYVEHLNAYYTQMTHKSWNKTTKDFQKLIKGQVGQLINGIKDKETQKAQRERFKELGVGY